jgi:hypothetical protein
MYRNYLCLKPWTTSAHFLQTWLFVQTPLAAKFPLEVLDCICNVYRIAIDPSLLHANSQEFSRRSNKRLSGSVFLVSWLFAHEEHRSARRPFAEYGLNGIAKKVASAAIHCSSPQRIKVAALRQEGQSGVSMPSQPCHVRCTFFQQRHAIVRSQRMMFH